MSSRVHVLAWSALHAAFWMHAAFVDWLRWLRWRAMSILPARKQLIAQPPAHLGIVFAKEEICIERIADLVAWCAEAGIGCITLCDWDGTLLAAENELSLALSTRSIAHSSQAVGGTADAVGVSLRVVTLQTGRDDLVEAARYFCEQVHTQRLAVGAIDEAAIDRYLDTANKSPELVRVSSCAFSPLAPHACAIPAAWMNVCSPFTHRHWYCSSATPRSSVVCCRGNVVSLNMSTWAICDIAAAPCCNRRSSSSQKSGNGMAPKSRISCSEACVMLTCGGGVGTPVESSRT